MAIDITVNGGTPAAPSRTSMPDFYSLYSKYGELAKSSRFLVVLQPPPGVAKYGTNTAMSSEDFTFLCESAEMPGRGFMAADIRYYGPNFKAPYQSTFEDMNLTFLCRDKFYERAFFDNWMEYINPSNNYDFAYRDSYVSQINVFQMSDVDVGNTQGTQKDGGQGRYVFTLQKAYPVLVNPQPVTWADDNFHRITVTFTYSRWIRPGVDKLYNDVGPEYQLINDGSQVIRNDGTKLPYVL